MKRLLRVSIALIILIFTFQKTFSQETDFETDTELKKFGIGLHIEQFKIQDLWSSSFAPVNNIIFTISPSNKWRLEPSIGFSNAKDEYGSGTYTSTSTIKGIYFGLGGFGMYQAGKTNLYFGARIEQAKIIDESKYSGGGTTNTNTNTTKRFMIGPVIGAEYFLGKHFSFGGEVALKNYSYKTESIDSSNPNPTPQENESNSFSTETGLLLRFYF